MSPKAACPYRCPLPVVDPRPAGLPYSQTHLHEGSWVLPGACGRGGCPQLPPVATNSAPGTEPPLCAADVTEQLPAVVTSQTAPQPGFLTILPFAGDVAVSDLGDV